MPSNPEDSVIAEIDALIDTQLQTGPVDDYEVDRYPACFLCGLSWHGLPDKGGCPGAYARGYQKRAWTRRDTTWGRGGALRDSLLRQLARGENLNLTVRLHTGEPCTCTPGTHTATCTDIDEVRSPQAQESALWAIWGIEASRRCLQCERNLARDGEYQDSEGNSPLCLDCYTSRERVRLCAPDRIFQAGNLASTVLEATLRLQRQEIAAVFGVPEELLGPTE